VSGVVRLSDAQIELYSRQIILREIGGTGQSKLLAARCLVRGSGAAAEMALSYLAGAGIGAIDLLAPGAAATAAMPLAPLATRCPDTVVRTISASADAALDDYDVVLGFAADGAHADLDQLPRGRARVGGVAVCAAGDGAVSVLLVPRAAGCVACVAAPDASKRAAGPGGQTADVVALGAAGALAALACCHWLVGIGDDSAARVLRLAPGSALWREDAAARERSCPRGCPPMGERL
jgi:hypothetical protein